MTFREATKIALKELGLPDDRINDFFKYADSETEFVDTYREVKLVPGVTERQFIENLKQWLLEVSLKSDEEWNQLYSSMKSKLKSDNAKN